MRPSILKAPWVYLKVQLNTFGVDPNPVEVPRHFPGNVGLAPGRQTHHYYHHRSFHNICTWYYKIQAAISTRCNLVQVTSTTNYLVYSTVLQQTTSTTNCTRPSLLTSKQDINYSKINSNTFRFLVIRAASLRLHVDQEPIATTTNNK